MRKLDGFRLACAALGAPRPILSGAIPRTAGANGLPHAALTKI